MRTLFISIGLFVILLDLRGPAWPLEDRMKLTNERLSRAMIDKTHDLIIVWYDKQALIIYRIVGESLGLRDGSQLTIEQLWLAIRLNAEYVLDLINKEN